jgi:hypothetical protein
MGKNFKTFVGLQRAVLSRLLGSNPTNEAANYESEDTRSGMRCQDKLLFPAKFRQFMACRHT